WLEPQLAPDKELTSLAGWANKLAGAIARLAGILHMAKSWNGQNIQFSHTIDIRTVEAAIRIGRDYLLPHARAAFGLMGADERAEDAKRVLRWLANSVDSVDSVDGFGVVKHGATTSGLFSRGAAEEMEAFIIFRFKRGSFRPVNKDPRQGAGRKPSPRYHVPPSVFNARDQRQPPWGDPLRPA